MPFSLGLHPYFAVADLAAGSFSLDSVQLDMQLPVLDGSAATLLPAWLAIDDAAIAISHDHGRTATIRSEHCWRTAMAWFSWRRRTQW